MNANEFKEFRKSNNLTQINLAEILDLTKTTIQNYESGESKIPKTVELSCLYLNINKDQRTWE